MDDGIELQWEQKHMLREIPTIRLIENLDKQYGDSSFPNLLIHGDNLLILHSLFDTFSNQMQCIYIDPPYNTGGNFEHYSDNVNHAQWLSFMRQRLLLLKAFLAETGLICVQIDDNEMAYLQIVMDEIFGRDHRVNTICVNMSNMSGPKVNSAIMGKRFPKIKEYILIYAKNKEKYELQIPKRKKEKWDKEYNHIIPEFTKLDYEALQSNRLELLSGLSGYRLLSLKSFMDELGIDKDDDVWKEENSFRIVASKPNKALLQRAKKQKFDEPLAIVQTSQGINKLVKTDFNRKTKTARIELVFAKSNEKVYFGDHWDDIVTIGGVAQEGGPSFPSGKKPEKLIHRILEATTKPNDWVMDVFLGSGTTAAVAHKMQRRWIGIELGEQVYSHCLTRLQAVIDGEQSGISNIVDWKGGGGFRFFESENGTF